MPLALKPVTVSTSWFQSLITVSIPTVSYVNDLNYSWKVLPALVRFSYSFIHRIPSYFVFQYTVFIIFTHHALNIVIPLCETFTPHNFKNFIPRLSQKSGKNHDFQVGGCHNFLKPIQLRRAIFQNFSHC